MKLISSDKVNLCCVFKVEDYLDIGLDSSKVELMTRVVAGVTGSIPGPVIYFRCIHIQYAFLLSYYIHFIRFVIAYTLKLYNNGDYLY